MNARMRRIASDYEQIKKDFAGHQYVIVKPNTTELPEKYNVTYFVNGIYVLPDGRIETLGRHEVEITLHSEYPRYKPLCRITTPIWHPNFKDGQICIGDIWGAGESLSDIIINIGDMIQYKSWNSYSPLSADAAEWAIQNKHLFPIGSLELRKADYAASTEDVKIDLLDAGAEGDATANAEAAVPGPGSDSPAPPIPGVDVAVPPVPGAPLPVMPLPGAPLPPPDLSGATAAPAANGARPNDFDITAADLAGIEFVPTAQRMQSVQHGGLVEGKKINFKTVASKGLLWGLIGGVVGWAAQEALDSSTSSEKVLAWMGQSVDGIVRQVVAGSMTQAEGLAVIANATRISTGVAFALVAIGIAALLGLGEGVYYGSKENALKYTAIGAGVAAIAGFISGYVAQFLYTSMLTQGSADIEAAFIRGLAWAIAGAGVGLAVGLIKPEARRIMYCIIGGTGGGFIGGFLFNFISQATITSSTDTGTVPRAIGFVVTGLLIGLGIGLLEQYAKAAWLKVVRGEFEGKEYLVFAGTTSIGNNGKNTIVLFKDKLVGPNHCDIVLEGGKYVLVDKGTPMGTVVNGQRITRQVLRQGDAIAIGNSVLVFNTK